MVALKQSAYYAIGIVMMKGISLVMIPYITNTLSVTEYGSLETLVLLADIGTILFSLGLLDAMYRYVGVAQGKEKQSLISNCFSLSVAVAAIGAVLLLWGLPAISTALPVHFEHYQIALLLLPTILDGAISIPLTLLRMEALAKRFCQLTVMKACVQASLTFGLLEMGYGIDGVLIAGAVSSVLLLIMLLPYQWKSMGHFGEIRHSGKLLSFALPTLVGAGSIYMLNGLDRWFMAGMVGVEQLAVYAVAVKFSFILGLALQPYSLWWFPNRIATLQQPNGPAVCAERAITGVNLGIVIATLMILTVPSFIELALPDAYQSASVVACVLVVIHIVKNAGDMMNLGCFSGDSTQSQMWIQLGVAAGAIVGYFCLTPHLGLWGVVSVLAIAYVIRLGLLYRFSQRVEPLPYQHRQWIKATAVGLSCLAMNHLLLSLAPWQHIAWASFIQGGFMALLSVLCFIKADVLPLPTAVAERLSWSSVQKVLPSWLQSKRSLI